MHDALLPSGLLYPAGYGLVRPGRLQHNATMNLGAKSHNNLFRFQVP